MAPETSVMNGEVIGELRFEQAGRAMCAALDAELRWSCEDEEIERFLNAACPFESTRFHFHRPNVHMIYQIAERLGARVELRGDHPALADHPESIAVA
jgi:hypothetical protein